ncbi:hypothetical protein COY17_03900 [Candidatus Saccharibacteria bacterium CG_4_10_14_0_2_um_filter_52_9]|nr:MAG: hypothetical protein COY17_03900 [Candidatus Saccharibacteria bacterium CG_4_10_14_0_2_um_filter_52_9]
MIKHNQDGAVNGVVVSLILTIVLLLGTIGIAAWAITGRQDYKNNSDKKSAAAAEVAKQKESSAKDLQFAEDAKNPLKTYNGSEALGSLIINFPKTWSGYIDSTGSGSGAMDGYFAPGVVPAINDQNSVFALRVKVLSQTYAQVVQAFAGQVQSGKLTTSAYALPKLPKVVGLLATGEITDQKNVTMVVLPLRSQTLQIWTEGSQYLDDFNKNILPNFSFSP